MKMKGMAYACCVHSVCLCCVLQEALDHHAHMQFMVQLSDIQDPRKPVLVQQNKVRSVSPLTHHSSFFLGKVTALWMCCVALPCCLFDLACFFLPSSHLSLKHVHVCLHTVECTLTCLTSQEVSSDHSDSRARDVCDAADGSQVRMTALFVTTPHFIYFAKGNNHSSYPRS